MPAVADGVMNTDVRPSGLAGDVVDPGLALSLLEAADDLAMIGTDLQGRIVFWNAGATALFKESSRHAIGTDARSLLSPNRVALPDIENGIRTACAGGRWAGEIEATIAGSARTLHVRITPRRERRATTGLLFVVEDVTSSTADRRLKQSVQFYTRSLVESNIDALMTTDTVGVITDVNTQMEALTGYSRAELTGTPFKTFFTDPNRAEQGIRAVLREGRVTNYELTALSKDGRMTVVSYNASTFLDSDNKLQGVFAAARDITEQKKLEQQLRDSEAYNRGLIEASLDGLITVDPEGNITDINEQMARISGYPREELIGTPFADYFSDPEDATKGVNETFEKGTVTDYVLTLVTLDKRQRGVSFNATVFRDPFGAIKGIFASARDITEQAQLQSQLAEERAYNRGLIEASLDGLITVDPILNITDVNETMCRMSGFTRRELIGSPFPRYFTEPKRAAEGVRLTLDKGAVTNYELTLKAQDSRESLVSFNAAIFRGPEGAVRGIFASARDITDQARLQTELAEEQAYNRGLIEASVDGLVTVDETMLITDVNETFCRMAGRSRSQLIGSMFPDYFTESARAAEGVTLTYKEGAVTNYVLTMRSAEATKIPVSFNAAVFRDASNRVRGIFASARDITAQQVLEAQLQNSQTYTRSLIESNIDALMTTDPLGIITDVNQQMERLTGVTRDELIGSPFKTYFTEPTKAEEGIRMVLRSGKVTNYELTARNAADLETVVSYNAVTFAEAGGTLQGVFAAARDITEQKALEEQLRESQSYNRGLIEASVDGLITVDAAGIISDVNDRMCQMTGYGRTELIGSPFAEYFTNPKRAREGVQQTFNDGLVTEYALTLIARGRRILHVSFNASVFKDQTGAVRGIFASARDITDRVRLEEQLREQQTYLRGLIESSVDGLITVDPEGFCTDVNEQMCRMTGYDRGELIGSVFKRYFTDPDRADLGVKRTLAEGVVTNYELTLWTKTRRKATVSFNASIFRGADEALQGIFASARDISEQARLQSQLAEQQAYNRSLIEASADALFAIAPDGVITDVNAEATRLSGYSRKHLINSRFETYFTDNVLAATGVQQTLREGRVIGYELTLITRYGRRITVSFNAGVFTDVTGKPLGILAAARDITEQKTLEQQLRDQQFYSRSLIESNIDALMTTDPLGIITDVNQQMEALTGTGRDELIGSPFKTYFTDPARAEDGIRQVLREGKVTNYELTASSKAKVETVVSYNATTFNDRDGKLQGVFAAARDVTERKQFETTLQDKNLELGSANQAKDRFLASMSHELRTPLNAIIGYTGTMLMRLPGDLTVDQEKQLSTIQSSGRHLLSLINDLLDLAKVESGNVQITFEAVDCKQVLDEVVASQKIVAEAKGLKLLSKVPQRAVIVQTDRRALTQIVLNLTNNAIKFTDTGQVSITLHQPSAGLIVVDVVDTGIGIQEDDQKQLFDAFKRVGAGAEGHEGTGLGLHLSRKLAQLLNGEIDFQSTYGKGSRFSVQLQA